MRTMRSAGRWAGLLGRIDRVLRRLYVVCGALAAVALVALAGFVLVNILSRPLGVYVPGMTEGAAYCMAAAGALGLAYTFGEHGHIRVELLLDRLAGRSRYRLELWALLATTALVAYLAWHLGRMVYVSWLFGDRSSGSDALLIWIPQTPVALGFLVFAVSLLHCTVRVIARGADLSGRGNIPTPG